MSFLRNAAIHRNYENSNTPVRISWLADRVEILSPGSAFGEVGRGNFGQGATSYRNPTIAEAMKNMGFMQRFGIGIATARRGAGGERQSTSGVRRSGRVRLGHRPEAVMTMEIGAGPGRVPRGRPAPQGRSSVRHQETHRVVFTWVLPGARRPASMRRCLKLTRRCGASSAGTRARATETFLQQLAAASGVLDPGGATPVAAVRRPATHAARPVRG